MMAFFYRLPLKTSWDLVILLDHRSVSNILGTGSLGADSNSKYD